MKKTIFALLVCLMAGQLLAAEGDWLTSLQDALAQAKKENKRALLDFTGSDWCPPCKALHEKVLTSSDFVDYAKKNLVLVLVDFPASKPQSPDLQKANSALHDKYNVAGFPTLLLLKPDGMPIWTNLGYSGEAPSDIIAQINQAKNK